MRAEREREIIICALFCVTLRSKAEESAKESYLGFAKKKEKKERRVRYHAEEREKRKKKREISASNDIKFF